MSFGANTPFILIARIQVKPEKVQEYLLLAAKTDTAVEASEPGMLHHTFDQDPENPLRFVWSEVYKNVLGRDADFGGLNYWLGQLNSGAETRYEVLLDFAESAENKATFT